MTAVSRGLASWHLLKIHKSDAAAPILNAMLSTGDAAFPKASNLIALRWLTRLDREKVKSALKAIYKKHIEYPAALDELQSLPAKDRPPLTDRWGKPWTYYLANFKRLTGVSAQAYTLQCAMLGVTSDITEALKIPYADTIKLKPTRVMSPGGGGQSAIIEFETTGPKPEKSVLSEGTTVGNITFVFAGEKVLLLADGDYWLIVPRPGTSP